jgi:hypothetical protein
MLNFVFQLANATIKPLFAIPRVASVFVRLKVWPVINVINATPLIDITGIQLIKDLAFVYIIYL